MERLTQRHSSYALFQPYPLLDTLHFYTNLYKQILIYVPPDAVDHPT